MDWVEAFAKGWSAFWTDPANVKDVVLPVAAILFSTAIALAAFWVERRSSRQQREYAAIAELNKAIAQVAAAADGTDTHALSVAVFNFDAASTNLHLTLPKRSRDITAFFDLVMGHAFTVNSATTVLAAAGWLEGVLIAWTKGTVSESEMIAIAKMNGRVLLTPDLNMWDRFTRPITMADMEEPKPE